MNSRLLLPSMLAVLAFAIFAPPATALQQQPASATAAGPPPIEVAAPPVSLSGVGATLTVTVTGHLPAAEIPVEARNAAGRLLVSGTLDHAAGATLLLPADRGEGPFEVTLPGAFAEGVAVSLSDMPGWLTLIPPIVAILLALIFRQIIPALFSGVWVGACIIHGGPLVGSLRTIDQYIIGTATSSRVSIIVFSLLLGGMVGIVSRSGGTRGLVELLEPYATNSRRGQVVTWLLGILIFFDDYANTLLVGNTMRPVTDRLKISREKLAYVVDSTAAPVASIALVSTWIGYEVSLIGGALTQVGSDRDAYAVFLQSLPYNFYPVLALVFGITIAASGRDFGPMLRAERRARGGKLLADSAVPLADFEGGELTPEPDKPRRWWNAAVPVLVVLLVTFLGLWFTGRSSLAAGNDPAGTASLFDLGFEGLGSVFGAGNSLNSLLWGSLSGCVVGLALAIGQRILTLGQGLSAWVGGAKSMMMAFIILVLAWGIADVCTGLNTSGYMVAALSDNLAPSLLPALVFVFAAATAFATGTSWGTMGILIPLAVPTAYGLAQAAGYDAEAAHRILLASVSSVLAGAIFGDHCSPISDTTVLSSMASGCDHVDHVRTQLPYAMAVAAVAMVLGYLPAGMGISPFLCLLAGAAALAGMVFWVGKPVSD